MGSMVTNLDFCEHLENTDLSRPRSIPQDSDHMTMEVFVESCISGGFIDYDGMGRYATAHKMSGKFIHPSDVVNNNYDKSFTHVVWFNR